MIQILVHISGQEPVKLDVEELPRTTDMFVMGKNPRERSDREITWVDEGVTTIIVPWWRINYIQILPSGEEQVDFDLPFR
jgi:hypothetical protein